MHPPPEDYWGTVNPLGLRSSYEEGKRRGETVFFGDHPQHRLRVRIARIFNTCGRRMHVNDARVASQCIVRAVQGELLSLHGDGGQKRSFCLVEDMAQGPAPLMNTADEFTGPVNLGNPSEFTIRGLAEKGISLTRSTSRTIRRTPPGDDRRQRQPDVALARQVLGRQPSAPLEKGLLKTIAYFEEVLRRHSRHGAGP